jgi:superfamily II DNA/RNA helicase
VTTTGFLKPVKTLKQYFTDLKVPEAQKSEKCLEIIGKDFKKGKSIIFCNTVKNAQELFDYLIKENGLKQELYLIHGKMSQVQRKSLLSHFTSVSDAILVATDLMARGVDLSGVERVILYDFPRTMAEYLHRVGRTARAGKPGSVFALITSRDRPFYNKIRAILNK